LERHVRHRDLCREALGEMLDFDHSDGRKKRAQSSMYSRKSRATSADLVFA
jgi:hypothetical protein